MQNYIEKSDFYEGVLDFQEFAKNYDLRCYQPSPDMAAFVEHYFVSRRNTNFDHNYMGEDVLSQPVASLFFTPAQSFFQGPSVGRRMLIARSSPLYVGAQFKPGGFYPFLEKAVYKIAERTFPVIEVLPDIDDGFITQLLAVKENQHLVSMIEQALKTKSLTPRPHLAMVGSIIRYLEEHCTTTTVAAVASHFNMSERSLQHIFRTYVGVGVKWAIMRARFLEVIKFARTQTKLNWTTVAAEFGYSDQSHFVNDFKKIVGQTPSEYWATART